MTLSSTKNYSVPSCDTGGIPHLHLLLETGLVGANLCHNDYNSLAEKWYISLLVLV